MTDFSEAETMGQRLRRLRLERGLSQHELSSPGVSYAYISRIETDTRQPSVKALRLLASKLEVPVEYLETGTLETTTDALVAELRGMLDGQPLTITLGRAGVRLWWPGKGTEDGGQVEAPGADLTEALMATVLYRRELAALREQVKALNERERELAAGVH